MARPALTLVVDSSSEKEVTSIAAGDLVRTGENLYPFYEVIAASGDRAWVRDVQLGSDHIVPLERLHKIEPMHRGALLKTARKRIAIARSR